ncbi:MAG TPA: TlpA family protein disulfide reductase [Gammaproteobacteria bacterium]|nr:TlpA family protein disulfide reductase [Gammaproteobacteria bacterium]
MTRISARILSLFTLIVWLASPAIAEQSLTKLTPAVTAPGFTLADMDGKKHKLSDYRGRPVIINFWATWCPPCRAELPSMNKAWTKIKDQGIDMLAVNVGEDEDTIFAFMSDYPIDFTILLDESGDMITHWPVKGLPTTFVINPEGKLVYRAIGGREWDDDTLLNLVRNLRPTQQR